MPGRTIGEAYVRVRTDTSGAGAEVRRDLGRELDGAGKDSGKRFGKSFGDQVLKAVTGSAGINNVLKSLHLDPIDINASPRDALAAIEATELKLKELSGDATTVEVKVRTEKARADLARFRKQLGDVGRDAGPEMAEQMSTGIFARLGPLLARAPLGGPIGAAIGATIAVTLAPILGAAVSGAVIGGAGIGGVVGGILLASKDARVQSAGQQLGKRFLTALQLDASPFITPLLDGMDVLEAAFRRSEGHIRSIFANAARYVRPLIDGLTGFLGPVIGGFDDLVAHAAPVIAAIRIGFAEVGRAVGDVFKSLSDNGVEAGAAIYNVFHVVAIGIRTVGVIINGLTEAFGWIIRVEEKLGIISAGGERALQAIRTAGDAAAGSGTNLNTVFQGALPTFNEVAGATGVMATNMRAVADAERDIHTLNADLFASETNVADALKTANTEIGKHHQGLRTDTTEGRGNRTALTNLATALQANYDKYVAVNGVVPGTKRLADELRNKFIALAEKAGLSATAANNLADAILGIPKSRDINIHANTHDAEGRIKALQAKINAMHGRQLLIDVAARVTGSRGSRSALAAALGKQSLPGRAAGGPVRSGMAYVVGERSPELFVPGMDGMIVPRVATAGGGTIVFDLRGSIIASERQAMEIVVKGYNQAVRERRIPPPPGWHRH